MIRQRIPQCPECSVDFAAPMAVLWWCKPFSIDDAYVITYHLYFFMG